MEQETTVAVSTKSAGIRFGLIGGLFSIVYFIVLRMANIDMQGPAGWVGWVVAAVLIFLAQKYYKDNGDGFLNYSQGIGIAFWYGLIGGAISSVFTFFYTQFIDNAYIDMIKDKQMEEMQSKGMSDQQVEQAMKIAGMFTTPLALGIMTFIFSIILSILIALIVTAITQKKRPETDTLDG
jgi:hypothetical protein